MDVLRDLFDTMPAGGFRVLLTSAVRRPEILRAVGQYNAELLGYWITMEGEHHGDTVIVKREAWTIARPEKQGVELLAEIDGMT